MHWLKSRSPPPSKQKKYTTRVFELNRAREPSPHAPRNRPNQPAAPLESNRRLFVTYRALRGRWRGRWRGRRRSRTKTPVISITGTKKASENKPRKQRTAHFEPSCGGTCVIQTRPRDKRRPAIYETTASQGEEDRTEQDGGLKGDLRTGPCRKTHTNRAADRPPDTNKHQTPKNLCPVIPKTLIPRTHRRPETGQTKTIDRSPD